MKQHEIELRANRKITTNFVTIKLDKNECCKQEKIAITNHTR